MSRRIAGAALGLALLTGCTSASVPAPSPSVSASPTSFVVSPAPEPTATASTTLPKPSPLPANSKLFASAAHGVKFALPSSWTPFDLTDFADADVKAALEPVAKRAGKSVADYAKELMSSHDLIVTGPASGGFAPSLSVRKEASGASAYMPTLEAAQSLLKPVSGTATAVTPLLTATGSGYAIAYTRPEGSKTLACALLVLPSAKGTTFLATLETDAAASRDALVRTIATTLQAG